MTKSNLKTSSLTKADHKQILLNDVQNNMDSYI